MVTEVSVQSVRQNTPLGKFAQPIARFDHAQVEILDLPLLQEYQSINFTSQLSADSPDGNKFQQRLCTYVFDLPLTFTSHQTPQFESALFTEVAKFLGVNETQTTSYHPQSNVHGEEVPSHIKSGSLVQSRRDIANTIPNGSRPSNGVQGSIFTFPTEIFFGTIQKVRREFFLTRNLDIVKNCVEI